MPEIGKWETTTQLTVLTGDITTADNQSLKLVPDGTGITQIGDAGTTSRGLSVNDDLFVSGKFEADGEAWFDYSLNATYAFNVWDNIPILFGLGREARINWSTVQTNHSLLLGTECGSPTASGNIIVCDATDYNVDFGHPVASNPTLYIQSADATFPEQHLKLYHSGTDGRIHCGSGRLVLLSITEHVFLSANSGLVYAFNSAANSRFRAFDSTGSGYIEIFHFGTDGTVKTNLGFLQVRGAGGVDLQETEGAGMRIPTSVPASPAAGSMYFDATTNTLYCHNGTAWVGVTLT